MASLTWCALLYGYSIAPRVKQGVSEEGGLLMWQGSLEYYLSLASSRDPHIPHVEPVERVRQMYEPFPFLCFPFSLSHTCINTHSKHAPLGSPCVNATRSISDSNAHFIAPIPAAFSVYSTQRSSYGTEILRFDQQKGCLTHIAHGH